LEKNFKPFERPEVDEIAKRFVLGMRRWMKANLDWSMESGRFVTMPNSSDTLVAMLA
jgi:hypothetical protein